MRTLQLMRTQVANAMAQCELSQFSNTPALKPIGQTLMSLRVQGGVLQMPPPNYLPHSHRLPSRHPYWVGVLGAVHLKNPG